MKSTFLLHHLIFSSALNFPDQKALTFEDRTLSYQELSQNVLGFADGIVNASIDKQERIAIFLEKRFEMVISCFGASCAGNIFIPINPVLKKDQVAHILRDSGSKLLVTSISRLQLFHDAFDTSLNLKQIVVLDTDGSDHLFLNISEKLLNFGITLIPWKQFTSPIAKSFANSEHSTRLSIDTEAVGIFYTSGSTGKPKGVTLSHRNMVFGAKNVASYLENKREDKILSALPLSFDAGFSQLTTAFHVGAQVILLNYLVPKDILNTISKEKITGMTAVPPLWIQLCSLDWPTSVQEHFRYFANTGGKMPKEILKKLRMIFPTAKPFLMYGLTESFRSTYLPPEEIDRRPDSIGKAIPNAEILILRADGTECEADETGELIHRGALVGLGYWNDHEKTTERYKLLPRNALRRPHEITLPEYVVFSGDLVRKDAEGFLYYVGRNDEMIKSSGYRISPNEIEEVIYNSGLAEEVGVFSVPHPTLEQGIIACIKFNPLSTESIIEIESKINNYCKNKLPNYMVPLKYLLSQNSLPRNINGKIDRKLLSQQHKDILT